MHNHDFEVIMILLDDSIIIFVEKTLVVNNSFLKNNFQIKIFQKCIVFHVTAFCLDSLLR